MRWSTAAAALAILGFGLGLVAGSGLGEGIRLPADGSEVRRPATDPGSAPNGPVTLPPPDEVPTAPVVGDDPDAAEPRWRVRTGGRPSETATVVRGGIAVLDATGEVQVLERTSGATRWTWTAGVDATLWPSVAGTVPVSRVRADGATRTDFLDGGTGARIGGFDGPVDAAAAAGPWLLTDEDGVLRARAFAGTASWEVPVGRDGRGWPTRSGAFRTTPTSVTALATNTGAERWTIEVPGRVSQLAAGGGTLAVATRGDDHRLLVVDRRGRVVADHRAFEPLRWVAVSDDGATVTALSETTGAATLHVVDAASGEAPVTLPLRATGARGVLGPGVVAVTVTDPVPVLTVVTTAGGLLLQTELRRAPRALAVPTEDTVAVVEHGGVTAWSLRTGRERWRTRLDGDVRLISGRPLVVRADDEVVALDPGTD